MPNISFPDIITEYFSKFEQSQAYRQGSEAEKRLCGLISKLLSDQAHCQFNMKAGSPSSYARLLEIWMEAPEQDGSHVSGGKLDNYKRCIQTYKRKHYSLKILEYTSSVSSTIAWLKMLLYYDRHAKIKAAALRMLEDQNQVPFIPKSVREEICRIAPYEVRRHLGAIIKKLDTQNGMYLEPQEQDCSDRKRLKVLGRRRLTGVAVVSVLAGGGSGSERQSKARKKVTRGSVDN